MDTGADRINAAALLLAAGPSAQAALVCGPRSLCYAQLRHDVAQAAAAWQDCGVEPGEVVVLRIARGIEQAVAFLGAMWAGAVPVPLPAGRCGAGHFGHPWDRQAPCRFILDEAREGYAGAWRDSVLTLPEWRAYVADSALLEPVPLLPGAPACWTDPRAGDGAGARELRHGHIAARMPQAAGRDAQPSPAASTLAMLRVLRRCGTALIVGRHPGLLPLAGQALPVAALP